MSNLDHALAYLKRGWSVCPAIPRDKKPLLNDGNKYAHLKNWHCTWSEYQKHLPTVEEVTEWWTRWPDANIIIITGQVSGIIVLDVDGPEGQKSLDDLVAAGGIPPTPVSSTGKGFHYLFKHPGGDLRNFARKLPGLDFRGDGGYIIAPPSIHPSGKQYEWAITPDVEELTDPPNWLMDLIHSTDETKTGGMAKEKVDTALVLAGIPGGERDITIFRYSCKLRNLGLTFEEAEVLILAAAQKCTPPFSPKDALAKLKQAWKYPDGIETLIERLKKKSDISPAPGESKNCTELGNSERLIAKFGTQFRYCGTWSKWLWWNGKRLVIDDTGEINRCAKATVRSIYAEAAASLNDFRRKELAKHAVKSESDAKIRAMINLAKTDPIIAVTPDQLDTDIWLFNVLNGTINLKSGKIESHSIDNMITKIAPVTYDPEAKCPLWINFLNQIFSGDQDLIKFIQKTIGYSLTGDTREQCLFFLYGHGSNGKSTFLETVQEFMGTDYCKQTPSDTLMAKRNEGIPNDIAMLKGTRLVSSSETEQGKRLYEPLVKQLTGGDRISARFMRGEWFDFKPTFKIFILTNHRPNIVGDDNGIWRRIRLIPFNVMIPDHEQDKTLPEKLKKELPGILNWAIRGCLMWQKEGLVVPEIIAKATSEYRKDMDILGDFFEEKCVMRDDLVVTHADLYQEYQFYVRKNGGYELSSKAFSMKLSERGFVKTKIGKGCNKGWIGIDLLSRGNYLKVYNGKIKQTDQSAEKNRSAQQEVLQTQEEPIF